MVTLILLGHPEIYDGWLLVTHCDRLLLGKAISDNLLEGAHVRLVEAPRHVLLAVGTLALFVLIWRLIVGSLCLFECVHGRDSDDLTLRRNALLSLITSRFLLGMRHQILQVPSLLPDLNGARIDSQPLISMVGLNDVTRDETTARVNLMVPK